MKHIIAISNLFEFDVVITNRKATPFVGGVNKAYKKLFNTAYGKPLKGMKSFPGIQHVYFLKVEITDCPYKPKREPGGKL